jgi:hypothetical protein
MLITNPNQCFYRHAFPALPNDVEDYARLEEMFNSGEYPTIGELQGRFPRACSRIDEWTVDGIRRYWWRGHQELIDSQEAEYEHSSYEGRRKCKVRKGAVIGLPNGCAEVLIAGERATERFLVPRYLQIKGGGLVTVHLTHIIETIDKSDWYKIK